MAITRRIAIASEYQQSREQRMKQNRDRFNKLGIIDLYLKLKPKRTSKPFKSPSSDPTQPRRRSSRLQNPPPVKKRRRDIVLEEDAKPEFDTEEHDGLAVKKGSAKVGMPAKDPNKPKRPPSAFFVFMEDFRVQYKKKHPDNKSVATVGKAAGEKWKSMSDVEKTPYVEKAEKRWADYEKNMSAYRKRRAEGPQDEQEDDSDKSWPEVNDEDDNDDSGKVAKTAGEKWKSMSDAEMAPYIQKVEKTKADYEESMSAYKERVAEGPGGNHNQRHGRLPIPPPFLETNTAALEYEQTREQRIKQNRERFEKLGILDLSLQLKPKRTPKLSNHRITPSLGPTPPRRRSFRLQNPPPVPKRSRDIVLEEGPAEDPDKPKRPATAFFVFLEDFRVQYQQKHPDNKSIFAVGKAGGEKWRSMSVAEKASYVEEMEKRKANYEKIMSAYKKKLAESSQGEPESDKNMSVVNAEDDNAKVLKAGGEKWRSMSDAEKAPYIEKAEKGKAELQNGPPVKCVNPKEDKAKRSRDVMLEEGAKPEFNTQEHDKLLGNTEIPSVFSVNRLSVKKGAAKKGKLAKHPKKPKRPPSTFFVFMEDFRVQYKKKHPDNKSVATFAKAAAEKWKSMSDAEKVPYVEEAEKRKADYEKITSAYKKRLAEGPKDEREDESDKSSSEVNDEGDGDGDDSGEDDDYDE